jgi:hypothetical protein
VRLRDDTVIVAAVRAGDAGIVAVTVADIDSVAQ